jgi:nicotinate-nucleotide--dimethylbenzimidazole phosphoribosyltransferase
MIGRMRVMLLAGCVAFAGLILVELDSAGSDSPVLEPTLPPVETKPTAPQAQEPRVDDLVATALAGPLFSPTRRPPETAPSGNADPGLPDVRLTGIVIEPDRRIAIFAVAGAKPLVLAEGETLKDWRLDSISAQEVSLSGPAGTRTLEPKPDANLVRPPPPAAAAPGQPQPVAQAGAAPAGAPGQPAAVASPVRPALPLAAAPRIQLPPNGRAPGPPASPLPSRTR